MRKWHPEAVRAVEKASVTTAGILINLSSFCSSIFDLAEAWGDAPLGRRISFVEWTHAKALHQQVILQGHGAYADLTKSYVEGIVGVVSAIINSVEMEDDSNRKIWFVADEFGQMGKIPVRPLFEVGRSRGVRCVVACQDLAQIEEIYGMQMVNALVAMCGTLIVGQMMQGETAEKLCKAFGTREVERANLSSSSGGGAAGKSSTLSFNRDEVALYKPSELSARLGLTQDGTGVKLVLFTGGTAYELFWPHYNVRRERIAHDPASWTTSLVSTVAPMGEGHSLQVKAQADGMSSRGDAGDENGLGASSGALVWDGEIANKERSHGTVADTALGSAKEQGRGQPKVAASTAARRKVSMEQGDFVVDRETGEILGGAHGESGGVEQSRGDARLDIEAEATPLPMPIQAPEDIADGSGERVDVRSSGDTARGGAESEREPSVLSDAMLESSLNAAGVFLAEPLLKAVHFAEALLPGLPGPKQEAFVAPRRMPKGQLSADASPRPAVLPPQHQHGRSASPTFAKAGASQPRQP